MIHGWDLPSWRVGFVVVDVLRGGERVHPLPGPVKALGDRCGHRVPLPGEQDEARQAGGQRCQGNQEETPRPEQVEHRRRCPEQQEPREGVRDRRMSPHSRK